MSREAEAIKNFIASQFLPGPIKREEVESKFDELARTKQAEIIGLAPNEFEKQLRLIASGQSAPSTKPTYAACYDLMDEFVYEVLGDRVID